MKTLTKPLTWFLSLFNFGVYNLSDTIDSLVARLRFLGLKEQAQDIARLTEQIEIQQDILIMLDGFKLLCMLISLVVLIATNLTQLRYAYRWLKWKVVIPIYRFFYKLYVVARTTLKTLFNNLFKSKS